MPLYCLSFLAKKEMDKKQNKTKKVL